MYMSLSVSVRVCEIGRYHGYWLHGQRHGQGSERLPDGSDFEGMWAHDMKDGPGTINKPDGTVVYGTWRGNTLCSCTTSRKPSEVDFDSDEPQPNVGNGSMIMGPLSGVTVYGTEGCCYFLGRWC